MSYVSECVANNMPTTSGTIHAQLFGTAGTAIGSPITSGITRHSIGGTPTQTVRYLGTFSDAFYGSLYFYDSTDPTIGVAVALNPQETENADVKSSTLSTLTAAQVRTQMDAALVAAGTSIMVISAVDGSTITVRQADTWRLVVTISGVTLSDYEVLVFGVKQQVAQADASAVALLRTDNGLVYINKSAPDSSSNGTLTADSDTQFTVVVHMAETKKITQTQYCTWYLKGFDTDQTPDEGYTLASGRFDILGWGVEAVA